MDAESLKQFVPSEVCLKCNGCCRYKEADSAWRPKLGVVDEEILADLILKGGVLDDDQYIKTIQDCKAHFCQFLKQGDNTCGIYSKRPLECSLYPFILSETPQGIRLYVHLACPYVQDYLPRPMYESYVAYLKEFFRREDIRHLFARNKGMLHDYSRFAPELLHVFDLTFL